MNWLILSVSIFSSSMAPDSVLDVKTFAKQVATEHPDAQIASLGPRFANYNLMAARAKVQPSFSYHSDQKRYAGNNYWNIVGGGITVPTVTGLEFYGHFDRISGDYTNPEQFLPDRGLYAAGFKLPLLRGLVFNDYQFGIASGKIGVKQADWKNVADLNNVLLKSLKAYWDWTLAYNEWKVNEKAESISYSQLRQTIASALLGERPIIDTLEAHLQWANRAIVTNESRIAYQKFKQGVLNHIWDTALFRAIEQERVFPPVLQDFGLGEILPADSLENARMVQNRHPELQMLNLQSSLLEKEKRYRMNSLLPKVDFKYNFLFEENSIPVAFNNFGNDYYKAGLQIEIPLLLRQERADYQRVKLRQEVLDLRLQTQTRYLSTELNAIYREYNLNKENLFLLTKVTEDYLKMLEAEETRFSNGESSVFIINQRENMYFQSKLKLIQTEVKWQINLVEYYHIRGDLSTWLGVN